MTNLAQKFRLSVDDYLAAEDGTIIGMPQIMRAIRREYQKLGKLVTESEFGVWMKQV